MFSNIVWLTVCSTLLGVTLSGVRRGVLRVSTRSAITTAFVLCILLFPVLSMTDDLLDNKQAALPHAAQTWRLASESSSVGLEAISLLSVCLLFLAFTLGETPLAERQAQWDVRRYAAWLTRAQRLRPPPVFAL